MFFPKVNPVVEGLNSYYIVIDKLIEHFQGEVGTGVIYFRGSLSQGAVFFESDHFMESFFEKNDEFVTGDDALKLIVENCGKNNYEIYIYYIEPEYIYLWSEISKILPANISKITDKNSFREVVENFIKSKNSGSVSVTGKREKYSVFAAYGQIIGFNSNGVILPLEDTDFDEFLNKCEGLVNEDGYEIELLGKDKPKKVEEKAVQKVKEKEVVKDLTPSKETINIMSNCISIFDRFVTENKKIKQEFMPLLKRKFIENVDTYDFLDPFAAEFVYRHGKINFTGKASEKIFVESIIACLTQIANEQGYNESLKPLYKDWYNSFGDLISRHNIAFPFK